MKTNRLEAFSDGVLAIVITVMVLELKVPRGHRLSDLQHVAGSGLLTYVLSFVYIGIYWNNHHHMFQLVDFVTGAILWANLGLLFFLSLFPFTTSWMDESHFSEVPVAVYGVDLLAAAVAYFVLVLVITRAQGAGSPIGRALGSDFKGRISMVLYLVGIVVVLLAPAARACVWIGFAVFAMVAVLWLVPDRRVERVLRDHPPDVTP